MLFNKNSWSKKWKKGSTVLEIAIAMAVGSVVGIGLMGTMVYGVRSAAALNNYIALDRSSRKAMDQLVADIRECVRVTATVPSGSLSKLSEITLEGTDGKVFHFSFDPDTKKLTRTVDGRSIALMNDCVGSFEVFQPFLLTGSWNQYQKPSSLNQIGIVTVRWTSTLEVLGVANTEDVVTAKIFLRNSD